MMPSRKYNIDEMIRLRRAGHKQKEIAAKLGCNQTTVSANLRAIPVGGLAEQTVLGLDPEIEGILTESFRKHMGYCPVADGVQASEIQAE